MTRLARPARLAPFLLAALAVSLAAPATARAGDAPPEGEPAIVIGADGMLVSDLLNAVSKVSGRAILWSEQDKAVGTKRVRGPARIPVKDGRFLETLQSILVPQEIVLVSMGLPGSEHWYATDARTLMGGSLLRLKPEWILVDEKTLPELEGRDGWYVSTLIPVENLDSLRDARNAVQRLVTVNNIGNVQEVPSARAFLVTDFAPNVATIWRALRQMDVPTRAPGLRIESFRLAHADAVRVKQLIDGLYPSRPQMPVQPGVEIFLGGPYAVADEETNQVFVRGSAPDLAAIRAVVQSVDVPPTK